MQSTDTISAANTSVSRWHVVRVGVLGLVGRFLSADFVRYPRGTRVIVRTNRGLEIGEILAASAEDSPQTELDGAIIRGMTVEDHLLETRLQKNRDAALAACESRIREFSPSTTLLDVELLFDGRSLFFYFLGDVPSAIESWTDDLAELYDTHIQFRKFADAVTEGCGPGCGTEDATGHGCSTCSTSCAIAGACGSKK